MHKPCSAVLSLTLTSSPAATYIILRLMQCVSLIQGDRADPKARPSCIFLDPSLISATRFGHVHEGLVLVAETWTTCSDNTVAKTRTEVCSSDGSGLLYTLPYQSTSRLDFLSYYLAEPSDSSSPLLPGLGPRYRATRHSSRWSLSCCPKFWKLTHEVHQTGLGEHIIMERKPST
ncbi:hypothetical protein VDGE_30186 [Verticillium dahliae]|uniref:Uncharacterized protein n=1 Tax=Verticillium dahliae TaxID=27337 RepID=A0A444RWR6_VERDA|nr:hypothetical protein VDGE_30186 [Verticillium dahliae]